MIELLAILLFIGMCATGHPYYCLRYTFAVFLVYFGTDNFLISLQLIFKLLLQQWEQWRDIFWRLAVIVIFNIIVWEFFPF